MKLALLLAVCTFCNAESVFLKQVKSMEPGQISPDVSSVVSLPEDKQGAADELLNYVAAKSNQDSVFLDHRSSGTTERRSWKLRAAKAFDQWFTRPDQQNGKRSSPWLKKARSTMAHLFVRGLEFKWIREPLLASLSKEDGLVRKRLNVKEGRADAFLVALNQDIEDFNREEASRKAASRQRASPEKTSGKKRLHKRGEHLIFLGTDQNGRKLYREADSMASYIC